jgi:hypothetical protein
MNFGEGFATDDVVAHEFTHKVTEFESGLLYQNESGAINECLSDIWGETFDQNNGTSLEPLSTIWLIGEDIPLAAGDARPNTPDNRALRDMNDPTTKGQPDRIGDSRYLAPASYPRGSAGSPDNNDDGGVHTNSGVGNKLFVLLVDGGTHNGHTISSIGLALNEPLDLFYEVQTNFLMPASDWRDLNYSLRQAAINLGFDSTRRTQVGEACEAVQLTLNTKRVVYMDRATNAGQKVGIPEVVGSMGPYNDLFMAQLGAAGGTVRIKGESGRVVVPPNYIISIPSTLSTYDPFIQVNPGPPPSGTTIPPAPVVIGTAP